MLAWLLRLGLHFFVLCGVASPLVAWPAALEHASVLTTAAQVHNLPKQLGLGRSVHLVGTITYYDPANQVMFLQDDTGAVFVNFDRPYPVEEGDLVELTGESEASYQTDVAANPSIRVIGRGRSYRGPMYSYRQLASGLGDCLRVTIRGKVRAADVGEHPNAPAVHLDLAMQGGEVEVYAVSSLGFQPESLLDADVEVTGVAGGTFDAKWQHTGIIVYVQHSSAIKVLHPPSIGALRIPQSDIDHVFETLEVQDLSRRVRVQGTVTYYRKGFAAVLEDAGKSIYVQTRQTTELQVGDIADAFGYADTSGYAPGLREAIIVKTGRRVRIVPPSISYEDAMSGRYSDNLVSLAGTLVSELHEVDSDAIVINADGHLMNAYLQGASPLPTFLVGSKVRITGICRVMPGNPWQAPYVFRLEMRTASDAELIAGPSWWTIRHLAELLCALTSIALTIAGWAMLLRARVRKQTEKITRSMALAVERSRILGSISANQDPPDVTLAEICASVKLLLPETECSFFLIPQKKLGKSEYPGKDMLFEVALTGPEGEVLGKLVAHAPPCKSLSPHQQDVYHTVEELATLSIRQSLLYDRLIHSSTHDALTELPNRRLFETRLAAALQDAEQQGSRVLVVYIDIDHFKQVNDEYGHKVGDLYLKQISTRLLTQIRPIDTLARVGGDEFIVIAPLESAFDVENVFLARLRACFESPFQIEGACIKGAASLGFASYPEHGTTAEDLKRNADQAMYLIKQSKIDRADGSFEIAVITPHELELALGKGLFRLAYQPQFSFSGHLTGLEALIRLEDPILGTLTPDAFISVAEKHDVICDIGNWVLREALENAVRWGLHTGDAVTIAVNVSVAQIKRRDFAHSVLACLAEHSFPPERLELELIERSLMVGGDKVTRQLEQLREAGVRISLDDFGTGQSCLSMLHKLPIDTIKLDRAFIVAMDDEPTVLPIIQAITSMAGSLGKRVVAEGLEHTGPVPTLLKMGAMDFQGYLLSRPLPKHEVDARIATWRSGIEMPLAFQVAKHL